MSDHSNYAKENRKLQAKRNLNKKLSEEEHNQESQELRERYNIPAKESATSNELIILIGIVLETGVSGTKAIKQYATLKDKSTKWKKEIASSKPVKRFKNALSTYESNEVMLSMIANQVYDSKDYSDQSLTGALTKLSKQVALSKLINDLRSEVAMLKKSLADKVEGKDWKEKAQELRESGMSLSAIAESQGVSKSAVGKYTKSKN